MFKWLLISKYLRRKLAPLFAGLAVTICTAMVIIVMSVMGGFLDMLQSSAQKLTGDVTIRGSITGLPYYDDLIERLEALPQVSHATPIVRGYGLIQVGESYTNTVIVEGIRPEELDRIVDFKSTLMWDGPDIGEPTLDLKNRAMDLGAVPTGEGDKTIPLAVIGIEVNPYQDRDENGNYSPMWAWIPRQITLTVLPVAQSGAIADMAIEKRHFAVINEFKSGLYEVDDNNVFVAFDELQQMLLMSPRPKLDPETFEETDEMTPARTSEVIVKVTPGLDVNAARLVIGQEVDKFLEAHPDITTALEVLTWEERHGTLLGAVKNEKGLVTFLFAIISLVAVVMVATTFYMIVLEKTRDIGVLRAIGASRGGVRNLFLGYGLVIGVLGAVLGMALAAAIVTHLNEIQAILKAWFGWQMWDPRVYFFERIPDRVDWVGGAWVMLGAVLSSVAGALVPAIIAARMNPVEALRYE